MKVIRRFKTQNYSMFVMADGNREFKLSHAQKLAQDIKQNNMLEAHPVLCQRNGQGQLVVYDGQHRLHACEKLKIDVPVVEVEGLSVSDIARINRNQKGWATKDYLTHFASRGLSDYQSLAGFVERTGLPVTLAVNLTSNRDRMVEGGLGEDFRSGKYKMTSMDDAYKVVAIMDAIKSCGCTFTRDRSLVKALVAIHRTGLFDCGRLVTRLKYMPLTKCASWIDYVMAIDQRYNYRAKAEEKVAIYFEATKEK